MMQLSEVNKVLNELYIKKIDEHEIIEMAKKNNQSVEACIQNLKFALLDLKYTKEKIDSIITENSYDVVLQETRIKNFGEHGEVFSKYLCTSNLTKINEIPTSDLALVTGFGPTNSPTAGTLSMIFRMLELQKKLNIYTHVIISDLGAYNSRQKPLEELIYNGKQFKNFILNLGFDITNGEIRTHNDYDHSRVFSIASSCLSIKDFVTNDEATAEMYKKLNLSGNDFSTMVDQTYTVSDIILPLIRDGKRGVIVSAGLEEHYYPKLSQIVMERLNKKAGLENSGVVGAIYGKLINGFFPYVKMSKSIPVSSINIGDSEEEIKRKIMDCDERNEAVVLQMIELASDWSAEKIHNAKVAFLNDTNKWRKVKQEYCDFFIKIKQIWEKSKPEFGTLHDELFF
ncbi:MAG: hypothetical protein K6G28_04695 [Acholeplasmatales bacterium]|nr:hypothetical protein [Acholeplasmatales bacterium]